MNMHRSTGFNQEGRPVLTRGQRPGWVVAWDLYSAGGNFRWLLEFAIIGTVTLAFVSAPGFSPSQIVKSIMPNGAPQQASQPAQTKTVEPPVTKRTYAPNLRLADIDQTYFERAAAEPLRTQLVDAFKAYKSRDYRASLEALDPADLNNPQVQLMRGLAYIALTGGNTFQAGIEMLERASQQNEPRASLVLGILNLAGVAGLSRDPERGRALIERAAATGDTAAIRALAEGFLTGWVGITDPSRSISLLKQAAAAGDAKANFRLGEHYFTGTGTPKNNAEAELYFLKAAEAGHTEAQAALGTWRLISFGALLTDDPQPALEWLEKAAAANEPHALYQLGMFYLEYGKRVGKADLPRGAGYMRRCVESTGNADCAFALAHVLENGIGTERDLVQAFAMYFVATSSSSSAKARSRMEAVRALLTNDHKMQAVSAAGLAFQNAQRASGRIDSSRLLQQKFEPVKAN